MGLKFWLGVAGLCAALTATTAQALEFRAIEVENGQDWEHGETGITLPAALLGAKRVKVFDNSTGEFDVQAQYIAEKHNRVISVVINRPGMMSVPLWFDRAHAALPEVWKEAGAKPATAFAPPGSKTANSMRVSYGSGRKKNSTALALVPIGDWMLTVRIETKGSAADAERMTDLILNALHPPIDIGAPVPAEIQPCGEPLNYEQAEVLRADAAEALRAGHFVALRLPVILNENQCREAQGILGSGEDAVQWAAYRRVEFDSGYAIALGDSGTVLEVERLSLTNGNAAEYSFSLWDAEQVSQFPQLSGMPTPQQALDLMKALKPVARLSRDTKKLDLIWENLERMEESAN